jgi:thiol-disulfide isomerase/thioredoxin
MYKSRRRIHRKPRKTLKRRNAKPAAIVVGKVYANWCGHCQMLAPEWEKMKKAAAGKKIHFVEIEESAIDAKKSAVESQIGGIIEVNGFPTIFKSAKRGHIEYFQGDRNAEAMLQWAMQK